MDDNNTACAACQSLNIKDLDFSIDDDFRLHSCQQCGLKFIKSISGREIVDDFYWDNINKMIYSMPSVINEMIGKQTHYLNKISKLSPPNKRLLDVGSGNGIFINTAKEFGLKPLGIEPSEKAIELCKEKYSVPTERGLLTTDDSYPRDFGIVTSWDVIEHVSDPAEFLRACHIHLDQNGILLLETPDESCLLRKIINILAKTGINALDSRSSVYYPSHRFYFTRKALTHLLQKIGFSDIKIYSDRTMYIKELAKLKYYHNYKTLTMLKYKFIFTILKYFPYFSNKQIIICRKSG